MHELRAGDIFAGYRIERVLGSGGMGSVYAAGHPRLPRLVALKLLHSSFAADPVFRARFEREAELAGRLDHPNIVAVHDQGSDGGRLWIAMQYVAGSDAETVLRAGPVAPEHALHIARSTAAALDYAHAAGLLHRDVKPANILLREGVPGTQQVLLTDFGIAKAVDEATALTQTGAVVATLRYAAPEHLDGRAAGPRADQYSLACTLFHLLTGQPPYTATTAGALIGAHLMQPVPRVTERAPGLPPAMDSVFARALAKDPGQRFATCTEMVDAAQAALSRGVAPSTDPSAQKRPYFSGTPLDENSAPHLPTPFRDTGTTPFVGAQHSPLPTGSSASPGTSRRALVGWSAAAFAVIAAVVAGVLWSSRDTTGTTTPPSTTTAAPTTTTTDSWAAGRPIIALFPDLLPAGPDNTGYRDLRCSFATKNPDALWDNGFNCTDREKLEVQVLAYPDAATADRYVASLPSGANEQVRSRYGRPVTVRKFNGSDGPWLLVQFDAAPHSSVLLQVYWPGHTHQEMIDQWLATAPL
ncbi:serine/threonine-protein kinase [Nocardia rosealba]|uniref:serine/threonine-protein kinase n=1 Tax=Nocardia rosealba TaxID=2878563 RepID=UPI001CD957CF|nr:serine/threonine-protein kinase [Nocardia rosealba]MCA2207374.1 serine/threonine protein kinase [Nocardia rosealba]